MFRGISEGQQVFPGARCCRSSRISFLMISAVISFFKRRELVPSFCPFLGLFREGFFGVLVRFV